LEASLYANPRLLDNVESARIELTNANERVLLDQLVAVHNAKSLEAMISLRSLIVMQTKTDNFNTLIRVKEQEMESITTELNLKNNLLIHILSLSNCYKQRLEDSEILQDALQQRVVHLEALIKRQSVASTQNQSIEVIMNGETETLPSNQADFQPNVNMAQNYVLQELESNAVPDADASIQE
jgi:hypothetical protein